MAVIKYLLVGGAGSGKSSILLSYVDKVFSEALKFINFRYISTIGVDFKVNTV
jgi:GTPase SAR1 family protein